MTKNDELIIKSRSIRMAMENKMINEKEQATIRLPTHMLEQLKQEAYDKGLSLNAYLIMLIRKGHQGSP